MCDFEKMEKKLSSTQKRRLEKLITDKWVVDSNDPALAEADDCDSWRNFDRLVGQMKTSEELHLLCASFNWDCGTNELERLLDHPLMDRGTLVMLFWMAQPEYFIEHNMEVDLDDWERQALHFVREIARRLDKRRDQQAMIAFDPNPDKESGFISMADLWELPKELLCLDGSRFVIKREYGDTVG